MYNKSCNNIVNCYIFKNFFIAKYIIINKDIFRKEKIINMSLAIVVFRHKSNNKYIYKLDNKINSIIKQFTCNYLLILTINILEILFAKI